MLSSPGQHQATNILNRLYAGLELRLPVSSSTCRVRPFPIATGLGKVGGVMDMDMSFEPAQWNFKVEYSVRSPGPTLYTRGSSAMA